MSATSQKAYALKTNRNNSSKQDTILALFDKTKKSENYKYRPLE